jgi:hypothetical protein
MTESRISIQIDECFLKVLRNESRKRRERLRMLQDEIDGDEYLLNKLKKLGLVSNDNGPKVTMKKNVVRTLIKT